MKEFKAAIEALPAKISVIRKIEVGLNMNPAKLGALPFTANLIRWTT